MIDIQNEIIAIKEKINQLENKITNQINGEESSIIDLMQIVNISLTMIQKELSSSLIKTKTF